MPGPVPNLVVRMSPLGAALLFACTGPVPGTVAEQEAVNVANYTLPESQVVPLVDTAPKRPKFPPVVVNHNTKSPYGKTSPSPKVSTAPTPTPSPVSLGDQVATQGSLSASLLAGGTTGVAQDGSSSGATKAILSTDAGTTPTSHVGMALRSNPSSQLEDLLFVDGLSGALRRYRPDTGAVFTYPAPAGTAIGQLNGLVYDGTARVFYASDLKMRRVLKLTVAEGAAANTPPAVEVIAGDPASTASALAAAVHQDADGTAARFIEPRGLLLIGQVLFVADAGAHRIRRIDLGNGKFSVTTVAGTASSGQPTDLTSTSAASSAVFNRPIALAGSSATAIYIADSENHLLRKLDLTGAGSVTVVAGTGKGGGNDGAKGTATFQNPTALALTSSHLIVGDRSNRLRAVNLSTGGTSTLLGLTSPGMATGSQGTASFSNPVGLAPLMDGTGAFQRLFVLDVGNGQASLFSRLLQLTGGL